MNQEVLRMMYLSMMSGNLGEGSGEGMLQRAYWDMLHDEDRNVKYFEAIKKAVQKVQENGKKAIVLDIGTGCGILAVMALQAGADTVYACEEIPIMVQIAEAVFEANGVSSRVHLIPKKSFEITIGKGRANDMRVRANILVTEIFASGIFDERVVQTINDARNRLLTEDCTVIPHNATIYAQVVDYPDVAKENWITPLELPNEKQVPFPESMKSCSSHTTMDPAIQISALRADEFTAFSDPVVVFGLEFGTDMVEEEDSIRVPFKSISSGLATAIFSWWELEMDQDRTIVISLRPRWVGGRPENFRYHWSPLVSYGHQDYPVTLHQKYYLEAVRGDRDIVYRLSSKTDGFSRPIPIPGNKTCACHFHQDMYAFQVRKWNDAGIMSKYVTTMTNMIDPGESTVLCLSDVGATILHIVAHHLGAKTVYVKQPSGKDCPFATEFIESCGIQTGVKILEFDELKRIGSNVDAVVADPFFFQESPEGIFSLLPMPSAPRHESVWYHLRYFELLNQLGINPRETRVSPVKAVLRGVLMDFEMLARINTPLDEILNGQITIRPFAEYFRRQGIGHPVENIFLWEYAGIACSLPFDIMEFNHTVQGNKVDIDQPIAREPRKANGVAMWIDWYLTKDVVVSTGPTQEIAIGQNVTWSKYTRQAVRLFHAGWNDNVRFSVKFHSGCNMEFIFPN